jgi:hypothetical protein
VSLDVTHLAGPLWIGSHPAVPGHRCGRHVFECLPDELARAGFEVVVLCAEEWQPSLPDVETIHAPFDDDHQGLDARQTKIAFDAAGETSEHLAAGKKTLVTCWAGRNRSGLVSALALATISGVHPSKAGELIRSKRDGALTNGSFRGILSRARRAGSPKPCELCEAAPITRRYHEDAICWIADCKSCSEPGAPVPMVVYREHGVVPPQRHLEHMIELLMLCGRPRRGGYALDNSMNTIPDHWHTHLRPRG